MKNKNVYTMKQPALGKRISELRKEQGMTQEELVAKCNINVRTIQRIEAGEVNPRSYTIKIILGVLGEDYFTKEPQESLLFTTKDFNKLTLAWIFGIVYFVISFIETAADFYQFTEDISFLNRVLYVSIKIISAISFAFFFLGFYTIARRFNNRLLKILIVLLITFFVIGNSFDVFSIYFTEKSIAVSIIIESILFGFLQLIFGIGIYQLENKLGPLAKISGILEIIVGACFASILFVYLGLFLLVPTLIVEILLLYKTVRNNSTIHDDKAHSLEW
jgi:transcriptional regulator with XRE-family HTH domain